MKITPLDIQQQQFKVKFRGFDIREVDAFLDQMAATFESLQCENENLRAEIGKLKLANQQHQEREESFRRTLLNSQNVMDQMKENARKSAELIVANADVKAEKILNRAHNRLSQLQADIAELKRQRMQIEVQIRSIIESHTKLLEMGKEEMTALDEEDAKVKLMPIAKR